MTTETNADGPEGETEDRYVFRLPTLEEVQGIYSELLPQWPGSGKQEEQS